ncbi:MAG: agmatinase [Gammaproteobacteria bacterium]|nr:agmatinase [Gammaproteobacteria bacterium]NIR83807.1 agmatinase [Gammaproteobacteria bacterium]NIR88224.1 agmatinase [Gammaproteobacteria bacterium]NIU05133.1 agmatinase [Gammaproteobacteria bacterium]NIV51970.1 agmatinase [Gammaproteobacteria bacterium]
MAERSEFANPMLRPRYTGIPTFMRTPFTEDLSQVDIGLIGIPFDGGVTNRTGARHGPREIRNQSTMLRTVNQASGIAPFDLCRVADIGDAWVESPFNLESSLAEITAFFRRVHAAGVVPISAGGDQSVTLAVLRGIAAERPVGLVHVDAHCDTGDDYLGSRFHHGAPLRRAVEEGLLDPERAIQIGIRGPLNDPNIWQFSHDSGMRVVYMEEFYDMGVKAVIAEARRVVGEGPTYVSFDVDGLDPVFAPGTGTPEVGGLTTLEAQLLLRGLRGLDLVGGDVVEVAPPFDPSGNTALVGATMMFEILCVVADAVAARRAD